jgi:POT family proton-dependent oligopeptide transporter
VIDLATLRSGFGRSFWVANTLELFERFAYYSTLVVLAVYLGDAVGLGRATGALLAGSLFNTLVYFLPPLAGTIVDRYGFKRSLLICFGVFAIGYCMIGMAGLPSARSVVQVVGVKAWVVTALIVTACGGSLIKPAIVGTVARTTNTSVRAFGYSIYYTLVNIGGVIGPLLAAPVRLTFGIASVLLVSSAASVLLFLATLIFYREPPRPAEAPPPSSMARVLADLAGILKNRRFVLFLLIFSGFWAMFWHQFYALPFYVSDYLHVEHFEWLSAIEPGVVILLTIPMAALAQRMQPFSAMIVGLALTTLGWFFMGAIPTLVVTVFGLAVIAMGEALQAPRFYEYVSRLAPPDRVGTYMGFAFLPIAIGSFIAGWSSGFLADHYVAHGNPSAPHMWFIVGTYGLVTTVFLIIYDRVFVTREAVTA